MDTAAPAEQVVVTSTPPADVNNDRMNSNIKSIVDKMNNYIVPQNYVPRVLRQPSLAKRSRSLCYLLRWGAVEWGVPISSDGYVFVDDLLRSGPLAGATIEEIRRIVLEDDKNRFSLTYDTKKGQFKVRANHGHGMPGVTVTERRLTKQETPGLVVHLTTERAWEAIAAQGLRHFKRNHIHFVGRIPNPGERVAGVRDDADVCIFIDTAKAIDDGIPFYVTPSGVVVSSGDEDGVIHCKYVTKVIHRNTGEQLYPFPSEPRAFSYYDGRTERVNTHDAYDNQFAYFVWARFGVEAVDVLMLLDTGASITILPQHVFEGIPDRPELHTTTVRIEVGNGANLAVLGVCRMKVQLGDYDFTHNFFVCRDSTHAILGNDFIFLQAISIHVS